jgi:hypothetical protein
MAALAALQEQKVVGAVYPALEAVQLHQVVEVVVAHGAMAVPTQIMLLQTAEAAALENVTVAQDIV